MAVKVFVYGPLMMRDVLKVVVGRELVRRDGTVNGYMQLRLKDQVQAALIPFPDAVTEGVVFMDVDEESLRKMDAYLGALFERGEVNVQVGEGEWIEAETHLFKLSRRKALSSKPWDEEELRAESSGVGDRPSPRRLGTSKGVKGKTRKANEKGRSVKRVDDKTRKSKGKKTKIGEAKVKEGIKGLGKRRKQAVAQKAKKKVAMKKKAAR